MQGSHLWFVVNVPVAPPACALLLLNNPVHEIKSSLTKLVDERLSVLAKLGLSLALGMSEGIHAQTFCSPTRYLRSRPFMRLVQRGAVTLAA